MMNNNWILPLQRLCVCVCFLLLLLLLFKTLFLCVPFGFLILVARIVCVLVSLSYPGANDIARLSRSGQRKEWMAVQGNTTNRTYMLSVVTDKCRLVRGHLLILDRAIENE